MVIIDSSVWIEAARRTGDPLCKAALFSLLQVYEATTCSPVVLEVLGGARLEDRSRLKERFSVIPHITATIQDWDTAVENTWKLRDLGHTLPPNDVLIGTMTLRRNLRAYAKDKHFVTMRDMLGLALYTPGDGGGYHPGD